MICIPIMARDTEDALVKIEKADQLADILEFRLDGMVSFRLEEMIPAASKPPIVTYRSKREGGRGAAGYATQTDYLLDAAVKGAGFIDVEYRMPLEFRQKIFQTRGKSKIILSNHLPDGTPTSDQLEALFKKMAATGADVVKIVTQARDPDDNLRVLNLIPLAKTMGVAVIAFCMGAAGRMSRIAAPHLGGYLTFASLEADQESAAGQIPVREMRKILEILKE
ncbi:MAG: type I 3-dehydroquinate dehydratase [Desulfobacterales bacterium]